MAAAARDAEECKRELKELHDLRREARTTLSEIYQQNKKLVEAYTGKKAEILKVRCSEEFASQLLPWTLQPINHPSPQLREGSS